MRKKPKNKPSKSGVKALKLSDITADESLQPRASFKLNDEHVADLVEAIKRGDELPPLVVYRDQSAGKIWLSEGFHRRAAYLKAGRKEAPCEVREGDKRAALVNAVGSNRVHGLKRTNEDKQRAVTLLHAEFPNWTNPRIAKAAGVSVEFVRQHRPESGTTREGTDGKKYPSARRSATVADSKASAGGEQRSLLDESDESPAPEPTPTEEQSDEPDGSTENGATVKQSGGAVSSGETPGARLRKSLKRVVEELAELETGFGRSRVERAAKDCEVPCWEGDNGLRWVWIDNAHNMLTQLGVNP